jgi:two-component system chemotaxis sensor kinase CheA
MNHNVQDKLEIDIGQFNQVFFEECVEHLAEMEQILIALSDCDPDDEQLNAIFRAAHSIKGGAGMFGFEDMTIVTHVLESLLDKLRNHERPFSSSMIDLFLEAGDVIAMQLSGHRDGSEVSREAVDLVRGKLQQVIEGSADTVISPSGVPRETAVPECGSTSASFSDYRYELIFTPDPDIFKRGVRLENLLADLGELGALTVQAQVSDPENFNGFDPKDCLTSWRLLLETRAGEAEIREIFEFVADEGQLRVSDVTGDPGPAGQDASRQEPASFDRPAEMDNSGPAGGTGQVVPVAPVSSAASGRDSDGGRRAYDKNEQAPGAYGRRTGETESSIRVGVAKVDQLINQVGELVITQLMLAQTAAALDPVLHENLHRSLLQLEHNTRDLQQSVMSIRLVPIGLVFSRFPRMVRELATKLGKQVELKMIGETTELDKGLIEKITDPLTHLVRNCLDHALETADVRMAAGKKPAGTITLRASQIGGRIVIDVIDDGAGLNREKILSKAAERGIPAADSMTDEEVWQLIFAPGFSTAEAVTDISGRGVGMDVVLSNVQSMNGRVTLSSEPDKGSRVTISLPLTLAILDGLSVAVGEEKFIIPLNSIIESLQPTAANLKTVNGKNLVQVRGDYIPIIPLFELFNLQSEITEAEKGILILIDVEGEKAAVLVDALLDEHQVVIKSIETNYRKVEGAAGATILGDGRVALILDVGSLLQMHKKNAVSQ